MAKINIRNKKTWKGKGFYIGRPSLLSNPFKITSYQSRDVCIKKYGHLLKSRISTKDPVIIIELLRLKKYLLDHNEINLVCHCSPKMCHGDIIKAVLLNKIYTGDWLIYNSTYKQNSWEIGIYEI